MSTRLCSRLGVFACAMLFISQPTVASGDGDSGVQSAVLSTPSSFLKLEQLERSVRKLELLSELEALSRELKDLVDFEFDNETKPKQFTDGESELKDVDSNNLADVSDLVAVVIKGYEGLHKIQRSGHEHQLIKREAKSTDDPLAQGAYRASKKNIKARAAIFEHNLGSKPLSPSEAVKHALAVGKHKGSRGAFSQGKKRGGVEKVDENGDGKMVKADENGDGKVAKAD